MEKLTLPAVIVRGVLDDLAVVEEISAAVRARLERALEALEEQEGDDA
jgi:hypothetical protein